MTRTIESRPLVARVLRPARRSAWLLRTCGLLFAVGLAMFSTAVDAAKLTVTVQNVRSDRGEIELALYASSDSFSEFTADLMSRTVEARSGTLTVTFENLPPGRYAVAAYHDENDNDEFDTNFLGMPQEGYGFSNDAPVMLGPPSFKEAAVPVRDKLGETVLSMIY